MGSLMRSERWRARPAPSDRRTPARGRPARRASYGAAPAWRESARRAGPLLTNTFISPSVYPSPSRPRATLTRKEARAGLHAPASLAASARTSRSTSDFPRFLRASVAGRGSHGHARGRRRAAPLQRGTTGVRFADLGRPGGPGTPRHATAVPPGAVHCVALSVTPNRESQAIRGWVVGFCRAGAAPPGAGWSPRARRGSDGGLLRIRTRDVCVA